MIPATRMIGSMNGIFDVANHDIYPFKNFEFIISGANWFMVVIRLLRPQEINLNHLRPPGDLESNVFMPKQ